MTPSPPRVKNYSTRWRVGLKKTKSLGEHGKTQGVIVGRVFVCLQQIFFYGHITKDGGVSHVNVLPFF